MQEGGAQYYKSRAAMMRLHADAAQTDAARAMYLGVAQYLDEMARRLESDIVKTEN